MITHECSTARRGQVAMSEEARDRLHGRCPGAYLTTEGEVRPCGCECHGEGVDLGEAAKRPLSVLNPPPRGEGPDEETKARKRPDVASKGYCEHCGAPCNGRFLPGHDAKLKSQLAHAASKWHDAEAWAELIQRDWARLVKVPVSATTQYEGRRYAKLEPGLTERRNRERREGRS